jgi:hypothetical protein
MGSRSTPDELIPIGREELASRVLVVCGVLTLIAAFPLLLSLPEHTLIEFTREDGPVEDATALLYFLAGLMALVAFVASGPSRFFRWHTNRNMYLLALAAFLLLCAGEEISWGQRAFGWNTPEAFEAINRQHETNIHNVLSVTLCGRLLTFLALGYTLVIPVAYARLHRARMLLNFSGMLIPPLYIGCFFLAAYLTNKIVAFTMTPRGEEHPVRELLECAYAAGYFLLATYFLKKVWKRKATQCDPAVPMLSLQQLPQGRLDSFAMLLATRPVRVMAINIGERLTGRVLHLHSRPEPSRKSKAA